LLDCAVRDLAVFFCICCDSRRLVGPAARVPCAESVLVEHQLLILIVLESGRPSSAP